MMDKEFDSHNFIKSFMKNSAALYGHYLVEYDNVRTVNSQIAKSLQRCSESLGISKVKDGQIHKSDDIFNNDVPCAVWKKNR